MCSNYFKKIKSKIEKMSKKVILSEMLKSNSTIIIWEYKRIKLMSDRNTGKI